MKKITIGIFLIVLFIAIGFYYINTNNFKLKMIGYSKEQTKIINTKLANSSIDYLVKLKHDEYLIDLIKNNYFDENNLKEYVDYHNKYNSVDAINVIKIVNQDANEVDYIDILIPLINNTEFKKENLDRYINYYNNNTGINADAIINIVNHNIDNYVIKYNDIILDLIKTDYFISENTERYINYYNENKTVSLKETVTAVNSNNDYDFYTNIQEVDLSKENLILVNKYYKLKKDFIPENLVTIDKKYGHPYQLKLDAYQQYKAMCEAAIKENLYLFATSPYRSYNTQASLYASYTNQYGKAAADTFSARAGHSEHQTGLAVDIVTKRSNFDSFDETMEFSWMQEHADEFGFILRYPKGKENITGYMYEPWHYRYVGKEVAEQIKELNITYEEYYAYYVK